VCADRTTFDDRDARAAAEFIRDAQLAQLTDALASVTSWAGFRPQTCVISGSGEFLARRLIEACLDACEVLSLRHELGSIVSVCAPAHAVAVLAREAGTS